MMVPYAEMGPSSINNFHFGLLLGGNYFCLFQIEVFKRLSLVERLCEPLITMRKHLVLEFISHQQFILSLVKGNQASTCN